MPVLRNTSHTLVILITSSISQHLDTATSVNPLITITSTAITTSSISSSITRSSSPINSPTNPNLQNLTFSIFTIILAAASLVVAYLQFNHGRHRNTDIPNSQQASTHELSIVETLRVETLEETHQNWISDLAESNSEPQDISHHPTRLTNEDLSVKPEAVGGEGKQNPQD